MERVCGRATTLPSIKYQIKMSLLYFKSILYYKKVICWLKFIMRQEGKKKKEGVEDYRKGPHRIPRKTQLSEKKKIEKNK